MLGPWVGLATVSLTGAIALGLATVGVAVVEDAQAQSAADASALAGAAAGDGAVYDAARRNDATVISIRRTANVVIVEIDVGGARATAAAERVVTVLG